MRLGCLELACRENRSMRGVFHLESLGFVFWGGRLAFRTFGAHLLVWLAPRLS
jgi:hypothetical protein